MSELAPSIHSSQADVWHLKHIFFQNSPIKIITQNFNGPCSFIAICNILILRRQIEILPHDRTTVSYEFLSQLVGEYLLTNCPNMDISAALSIMPSTTKGLDLNPQFTNVTAFSPASDAGELDLFAQAGIQLVHGWVVDPDSPEAPVMSHIRDYDTAATLIADADYITKGQLLGHEHEHAAEHDENGAGPSQPKVGEGSTSAGPSSHALPSRAYSDDQRRKIEHAIIAQQFLDATKAQLTYHGLFQLASTLQPGSLVALFRNAHLSVVYKSPGPTPGSHTDGDGPSTRLDPKPSSAGDFDATTPKIQPQPTDHTQVSALYALVTDDAFLHEPSVVWERLEDIDGTWSTFVDSDFHPAVPIGGDIAGQTAEGALARFEREAGLVDHADQALARQLQAEEDEHAREVYQRRLQALERRRAEEAQVQGQAQSGEDGRRRKRGLGKKTKNCVLM